MNEARCLIIGAGVGGSAAGAALAQRGFQVDVIERNSTDAVLGVGIGMPPNALQVVDSLGVLKQCREVGFASSGRALMDHLGNETFTEVFDDEHGRPRDTGIPRPLLSAILLEAAEKAGASVRHETTIVSRDENADGTITVEFSDGVKRDYDVVVAFDGIRSQTRAELFGSEYDAQYTGFGVLRINLERPESLDRILQFIGPHNKAGLVPISDKTMYLFLVIEAPDRWRPSGAELTERLRSELTDFGGILGDIRDALDESSEVIYSPIEEVRLPAPWNVGSVLVAGDAAHACAPHLTQGGALALEDAVVFAEELAAADTIAEAMGKFMERREARTTRVREIAHTMLFGEMDPDEEHRKIWPAQFGRLMGEANELLAVPA